MTQPPITNHEAERAGRSRAALRHRRRTHGGRGRAAEGHGLRDGRRPACRRGSLYRLHPDGDLRIARLVARPQRQFHGNARDPDCHAARTGRAGRRCRQACRGDRHAGRAGRRDASRGEAPEAGIRGEFHLGTGAYRLQGGNRPRDRAGPGAQAPWGPHHETRLLCRSAEPRATGSGNFADHAGGGGGDVRWC